MFYLETAINIALMGLELFMLGKIALRLRLFAGGTRGIPLLASEMFLKVVMSSFFLIFFITYLTGLCGFLNRYSILVLTAILYFLVMYFSPPPPAIRPRGFTRDTWPVIIPVFLIFLIFLAVYAILPPFRWDAMTYHLYIPACWVQEGKIFHVPTVFSDNAAAFAPKNFFLLNAWMLALLKNDTLLNCAGFIMLLVTCICIFRLSRTCGIGKYPSIACTGLFACQPFIVFETFSANADLTMLAALSCATYWLARFILRDRDTDGLFCALACGLALGTKVVAAIFVPPLFIILLILAVSRKNWPLLLLSILLVIVSGGWWYLENLIFYGSPLFPAEVSLLGVTIFPGAYGRAALQAGEFHAQSTSLFFREILFRNGLFPSIMIGAGLISLTVSLFIGNRKVKMIRLLLFGMFCWWFAGYWLLIPHNLQARFMFPAMLPAAVGFAWLLGTLRWKSLTTAAFIIFLALFVMIDFQRLIRYIPGIPWQSLLILAVLFAGSFALLHAAIKDRTSKKRRSSAAAGCVLLLAAAWLATASDDFQTRKLTYFKSDFRFWAIVSLPLNNLEVPPQTVAYAGMNIPYTLVGQGLKNRVIYCNVQGGLKDGFYDFWKLDPRKYNYHKPGIYRFKPNYQTWLQNLYLAKAGFLVVFQMNPAAIRYLGATKEGFPKEDEWAQQHPNTFKLEWAPPNGAGKIYKITYPDINLQDRGKK